MPKLHCTIPADHTLGTYYDQSIWEHSAATGYQAIRQQPRRDRRLNREDLTYIRELYNAGDSVGSIAAELGLHCGTVKHHTDKLALTHD